MSTVAAEQIGAQGELADSAPMGGRNPAELGAQAQAAGAQVTGIDADELLSYIRDLESRVQAVEAERQAERDSGKPDLVTAAELLHGHIAHRSEAIGGKGSVLAPFVDKAKALVEAAGRAVESGDGSEVRDMASSLASGLARVASAAASADVSYPVQLAAEVLPDVLSSLRKRPAAQASAQVLSRSDAPVRPALGYHPVG
jgi:hypothetical protein